ncbi:HlyC/CorC family transporter [Hahella sp. SMD15-11]|uniref:HlyC/CorC family transporter n=1 Tax=Thermohahella caldifontis TaxID=3142973 RepID=A0AB39V0C0_9GAMM
MSDLSDLTLFLLLGLLILLSAFFSSSETGMMSLNRYRLRHLRKQGHRSAALAARLLERPDQLIGVILIGNNFVNILASSIATLLALRFWGEGGIAAATLILTLVILVFAEVTPKTIAALHPERIAFPAAYVLLPLLKVAYPMVWLVNLVSGGLMRLAGIRTNEIGSDHLSREELKTLVREAGNRIPKQHQDMLVSILELEQVTVEDIMIPRNEISGIDLDDDLDHILNLLKAPPHTRLPLYKGDINDIVGIFHTRNSGRLLSMPEPNKAELVQMSRPPYFIPEGTPLHTLLFNMQREKRRIGVVVDEYGEVIGLATLEDILEEIVGEFTTDLTSAQNEIAQVDEGVYRVSGSVALRTINKTLNWKLPTQGPRTLSGLIIEALEFIPDAPVCVKVGPYRIQVQQVLDNRVRSALISRES